MEMLSKKRAAQLARLHEAQRGRPSPLRQIERNQQIATRHIAGETLTQIAVTLGVSRERVRQIVRKEEVSLEITKAVKSAAVRLPREMRTCANCRKEFEAMAVGCKSNQRFCSATCANIVRGKHARKYSREMLILHLQQLAEKLGYTPGHKDILESGIWWQTYYYGRYFNKLSEAQVAAGLVPNKVGEPGHSQRRVAHVR